MKGSSSLMFLLLGFVAISSAQYSYPKPQEEFSGYTYKAPPPPPKQYLPPRTTTTTTTPPPRTYLPPPSPVPYYKEEVFSPQEVSLHENGAPYDFTYSVKDDEYSNDYARNEKSDGDNVQGEYRTLLPDGRMQIVRYSANWKDGYTAEVTYQGEARYDP